MSSGEHRLELDTAPTEPAPPPFEEERETLPSMLAAPVPDLSHTIDLDDSELF